MAFRNLLKTFGAWTTLTKWHEPWMYRVRLKGDWLARLAVAFAIGSFPTTLLLILFAVNVKPPHPFYAFTGMLIFGGLALMFLVNGRKTSGGRVRLCEEGIIRRRIYVGLSAQWAEEWSWPYDQIQQCAVIPAEQLGRSFSVLMLTDGAVIELIGVPARVDLEQVVQVLVASGIVVRRDVSLPPQFAQPMRLPIPLVASAFSLLMLFGALGFYAVKTSDLPGMDVANVDRHEVRPEVPEPIVDARNQVPAVEPAVEPAPAEPSPPAPADSPQLNDASIPSPPNPLPTPNLAPPISPPDEANASPASPPAASDIPPPATTTTPNPFEPLPANTIKTDQLGGTGGAPFELIPRERVPIVGFRYRLGNWGGKSAVAALEPINERNPRARFGELVIAREGFVVGGIQVDAEELVEAVRVVFVKQASDGTLDKSDYYFSDWIGTPTGRPLKLLGKGTIPVVGVFGRRGLVTDAIGLVLEEK